MMTGTEQQTRWRVAFLAAGAAEASIPPLSDLQRRYAEPARAYHTAEHLHECFAEFDRYRAQADDPSSIELAIWYHDVVYHPKRMDNEAASAALARKDLEAAEISEATIDRVEALILATRHTEDAPDADTRLLIDIDLAILGADEARFDEYEAQITAEYRWVPAPIFRHKRAELLELFLAREAIYGTEAIAAEREAPARRNLKRALARLRA